MEFVMNFTTKQGLALDAVSTILIDRRGRMWIGTMGGGISIFDGTYFENLQNLVPEAPSMNIVSSLFEDRQGNIWIGTWQGVYRFDGLELKTFFPGEKGGINPVRGIAETDDGRIFFGTDLGLFVYDQEQFRKIRLTASSEDVGIFRLLPNLSGTLWLGTEEGVYTYDGKEFQQVSISELVDHESISSLEQDSSGTLWVGTFGGEIFSRAGESGWKELTGWTGGQVRCIQTDPKGNIWIGSGKGLYRYFDGQLTDLTGIQNMPRTVSGIISDKKGNLWMGSDNQGIFCLRSTSFSNFIFEAEGINTEVFCLGEDPEGRLFLGTEIGLYWFSDKDSVLSKTRSNRNGLPIAIFRDRSGDTWVGGDNGNLVRWSKDELTLYTSDQGLPRRRITGIDQDAEGNIWFTSLGNGLYKLTGDTLLKYDADQGLPDLNLMSVTIGHDQKIWLSSWTDGVMCLDGNRILQYTEEQGLPNRAVSRILEDSCGNLWFASHGGLTRFDGSTLINFTFREGIPDNMVLQLEEDCKGNLFIGTNQGISKLLQFASSLKNQEFIQPRPRLISFSESQGYPIKNVNTGQKALLLDHTGILWIATGSLQTGLVRIDPEALPIVHDYPTVQIDNLKVENQTVCWSLAGKEIAEKPDNEKIITAAAMEGAKRFGKMALKETERDKMREMLEKTSFSSVSPFNYIPQELVLPYRLNNLTFEFSAVDLTSPQLLRYRYFLEGYDRDWSPWSDKTSATFGNIKEGKYILKIEAAINQFDAISQPLIYSFRVLPPLWRSPWAYAIYVILAITGLIMAIRLYNLRLIRRNAVLTKTIEEKEKVQKELIVARDKAEESDRLKSAFLANMSHEIRTPMNGILGFTGLLKEADLSGDDQQRYIGIIEKSGDRLLNIITNIVTYSELEAGAKQVNVTQTDLNEQLDFLYSFFLPQAEHKGLRLECGHRLPEGDSIVHTDKEKIYSILTNLLKNAMNFTEKGSISFGCIKNPGGLEFYVRDTGIGIREDQKPIIFNRFRQGSEELTRTHEGAGLGLSIAKGYVDLLGGKIWVEDNPGGGSTFRFTVTETRSVKS
jgi:signal transduction histidine kinase/ligand-binding sensor domain-containing protein